MPMALWGGVGGGGGGGGGGGAGKGREGKGMSRYDSPLPHLGVNVWQDWWG